MTIISKGTKTPLFEDAFNLPPVYGNCTCDCHRMPNVHHIMPCCYPTNKELEMLDELLGEVKESLEKQENTESYERAKQIEDEGK